MKYAISPIQAPLAGWMHILLSAERYFDPQSWIRFISFSVIKSQIPTLKQLHFLDRKEEPQGGSADAELACFTLRVRDLPLNRFKRQLEDLSLARLEWHELALTGLDTPG